MSLLSKSASLLLCGAAVAGLVVRSSPRLSARWFYWRSLAQASLFYGINTVKRKLCNIVGIPLAPYGGTTSISPKWMQKILEDNYKTKLPALLSVEITDDKIAGGFNGKMMRIRLHWSSPPPAELDIPSQMIIKSVQNQVGRLHASLMLGTPREALFSREYGQNNRDPVLNVMPRVIYANGSWWSGEYVTIMEDLSLKGGFHGGVMLGNQCFGEVPVPDNIKQDPLVVVDTIFAQAADIHAKYWRDEKLLKYKWMKNVAWIQGHERGSWEMAMINMRHRFNTVMKAFKSGKTKVPWSDHMISTINNAFENTNWRTFRSKMNLSDPTTPFTLCHGDFHASNTLWCPPNDKSPTSRVYLIDWSEVGVFCPFTELAQFIVSHITVADRRAHEREIFERYYNHLVEKGVDSKVFPLEDCWKRYQIGGIERWLLMLILLAGISIQYPQALSDDHIAWFYNQVSTFVEDHGTPEILKSLSFMSGYCLA
jgi:thiamine kinase-like enzyme